MKGRGLCDDRTIPKGLSRAWYGARSTQSLANHSLPIIMPAPISSKTGRVKKSKLDKIFELEAELKVIKDENLRLQKALTAAEESREGTAPPSGADDEEDATAGEMKKKMKRMKEAFIALKNVTVTQEKSIHSLRVKALERRRQLEMKDKEIEALKRKVGALQKLQEGLTRAKCPESMQIEIDELQEAFFDEQTVTAKLELKLIEKEKAIFGLQNLLKAQSQSRKNMASTSAHSTSSVSEVSQLKNELSRKDTAIVELQSQIDTLTESLYEHKQNTPSSPRRAVEESRRKVEEAVQAKELSTPETSDSTSEDQGGAQVDPVIEASACKEENSEEIRATEDELEEQAAPEAMIQDDEEEQTALEEQQATQPSPKEFEAAFPQEDWAVEANADAESSEPRVEEEESHQDSAQASASLTEDIEEKASASPTPVELSDVIEANKPRALEAPSLTCDVSAGLPEPSLAGVSDPEEENSDVDEVEAEAEEKIGELPEPSLTSDMEESSELTEPAASSEEADSTQDANTLEPTTESTTLCPRSQSMGSEDNEEQSDHNKGEDAAQATDEAATPATDEAAALSRRRYRKATSMPISMASPEASSAYTRRKKPTKGRQFGSAGRPFTRKHSTRTMSADDVEEVEDTARSMRKKQSRRQLLMEGGGESASDKLRNALGRGQSCRGLSDQAHSSRNLRKKQSSRRLVDGDGDDHRKHMRRKQSCRRGMSKDGESSTPRSSHTRKRRSSRKLVEEDSATYLGASRKNTATEEQGPPPPPSNTTAGSSLSLQKSDLPQPSTNVMRESPATSRNTPEMIPEDEPVEVITEEEDYESVDSYGDESEEEYSEYMDEKSIYLTEVFGL